MTQPPSPSAAARRKPDNYWVRIHANSWWYPAHMFLSDGEERYIVAGGAHAYYTKDMLSEIGPRLIDPEEAAERAKPTASDHEAATLEEVLSALMDEIEQAVQDQFDEARKDFADEIYPADIIESIREMLRNTDTLAAALAERGRVERERAAKIAENPGFIQAQDTEWDEGVNYAKRYIAAAIRNQTINDEA